MNSPVLGIYPSGETKETQCQHGDPGGNPSGKKSVGKSKKLLHKPSIKNSSKRNALTVNKLIFRAGDIVMLPQYQEYLLLVFPFPSTSHKHYYGNNGYLLQSPGFLPGPPGREESQTPLVDCNVLLDETGAEIDSVQKELEGFKEHPDYVRLNTQTIKGVDDFTTEIIANKNKKMKRDDDDYNKGEVYTFNRDKPQTNTDWTVVRNHKNRKANNYNSNGNNRSYRQNHGYRQNHWSHNNYQPNRAYEGHDIENRPHNNYNVNTWTPRYDTNQYRNSWNPQTQNERTSSSDRDYRRTPSHQDFDNPNYIPIHNRYQPLNQFDANQPASGEISNRDSLPSTSGAVFLETPQLAPLWRRPTSQASNQKKRPYPNGENEAEGKPTKKHNYRN
ncbi:homeobox protein 2-like [Bombina bombina]|uniref:homeobox protein 2-like n=1 Tax=Bombina bombina TaxID=8345 RepID=UPI00235A5CE3|nr:homeobox protein 2-like [Bombina bombina]